MEQRREAVLRWLDRSVAVRPNEIAVLLRRWWAGDATKGHALLQWFRFVSKSPGDGAIEKLFEQVVRETP